MDGDFDGRPEWVDHYQGNIRVMTEIDTNYDGKADLFRYYEKWDRKTKNKIPIMTVQLIFGST